MENDPHACTLLTRAILIDIEGTTTPISFVTATHCPYAPARRAAFVRDHAHDAQVQRIVAGVWAATGNTVGPGVSAAVRRSLHCA